MSCPSAILNSLNYEEKKSILGVVAVALPADDLADGKWSFALLEDILTFLDLDKELAEGFYPITERARLYLPPPADPRAAWKERVEPFRVSLPPQGETRCIVLRDLMVLVALRCGYDARTRVIFRRVCDAIGVSWHPRVSEVESTLARKVYERVTRDREREIKSDRWRGVKIGAAMVSGGALLAVTGGLAAPALAAGITATSSLIGTTAAATLSGFATTTWMATVFGATGAGLVGYKMDRRTKGVKEFEFESETTVGEEMSVSICVPGVLKDKADLQRAWGLEPRGPDVSARERLRRFYYVYNRDKMADVDDILVAYDGRESSLCKNLVKRYGADPRDPLTRESLALWEGRPLESVAQEDVARDAEAIGELIEAVLNAEEKKKEKTKTMSRVAARFSSAVHSSSQDPRSSSGDANEPAAVDASRDTKRTSQARTAVHVPTATPLESPLDHPPTVVARPLSRQDVERVDYAEIIEENASHGYRAGRSRGVRSDGSVALSTAGREGTVTGEDVDIREDYDSEGEKESSKVDGLNNADGIDITLDGLDKVGNESEMEEQDYDDQDYMRDGEEEVEEHRVWFWQDKLPHTDQYVLRWETNLLVELGKSVQTMLKSLRQSAVQEALKYTTLAAIMTSLTWPLAIISLSSMIDADWTIGKERADIAGKLLADALLNREQGCRPVTLVGTSLGARLIFACLEEIARRHELWEEEMLESSGDTLYSSSRRGKNRTNSNRVRVGGLGISTSKSSNGKSGDAKCAAGVIENVCLLGAAVGASTARWERVARVVHGRIINGYSRSDYILGLLFRAKSLSLSVAGVQKVSAARVENVDLSHIIGSNHANYNQKMPEILPLLALDDCSKYVGMRGAEEDVESQMLANRRSSSSIGGYNAGSSAAARAEAVDGSADCIVYGTTVVP